MTAEQLALEQLAEKVAKIAAEDVQLLVGGDPSRLVAPILEGIEHGHAIKVTMFLLQRFIATVSGKLPALEPLAAVCQQVGVPTLERLLKCLAGRHAFKTAFSLAPLLCRTVAMAAQCCGLAMRSVADLSTVRTLTRLLETMFKVLGDAVADRVERFRPLDASMLSAVHQVYAAQQGELARALTAAGVGAADVCEEAAPKFPLAPLPERQTHAWRNDELRQFWVARCAHSYETVPFDVLALLLLCAASAETSIANREAVMRRLAAIAERKSASGVSAPELDGACAQEIRRTGGLKAWVHALTLPGGIDVAGPGPHAAPRLKLAVTSGVSTTASTWPMSARTTTASSMFSARSEKPKPFALSASGAVAWRRPLPTEEDSPPRGNLLDDGSFGGSGFAASGNLVDNRGIVMDSVERGLLRTSQRLILGNKLGVNSPAGTWRETPLHQAAVQDRAHAPAASLLLERGADANAEDRHLATPLHIAASTGHSEVARRLVQCGADVCREDRWQVTPLHKAADNGRVEVTDLLLKSGAAAAAADMWGATPLHRASARGQLAVAEQLLNSGNVDVDAEDSSGRRPLHVAASNGDYALVKLLLESGAAATARSRVAGKTPEDCARERGHLHVVTLLQNRADWVTPRSQALLVAA